MTLVLVAAFWGAGIPISAMLARDITPLWAVSLRVSMSAVFLFLFFPKKILTSTRKDWRLSSVLALIMVGVFVTMTFGLFYSTASKQAFIGGLNVIMVPLLLWAIYKARPSGWVLLSAGLTTLGLLVMGFTPGMEFNLGDLLSFFMAIFYALQCIGVGYCARRVDPVRLVALHIIVLAAMMLPLALIFEPLPHLAALPLRIWAALLCVSLVNTIICFIVQFKAQRVSPESHVAIILSLESFFGYVIAVASGQDPFHLQGAVGGLLILAGMMLTEAEGFLSKTEEKNQQTG